MESAAAASLNFGFALVVFGWRSGRQCGGGARIIDGRCGDLGPEGGSGGCPPMARARSSRGDRGAIWLSDRQRCGRHYRRSPLPGAADGVNFGGAQPLLVLHTTAAAAATAYCFCLSRSTALWRRGHLPHPPFFSSHCVFSHEQLSTARFANGCFSRKFVATTVVTSCSGKGEGKQLSATIVYGVSVRGQ